MSKCFFFFALLPRSPTMWAFWETRRGSFRKTVRCFFLNVSIQEEDVTQMSKLSQTTCNLLKCCIQWPVLYESSKLRGFSWYRMQPWVSCLSAAFGPLLYLFFKSLASQCLWHAFDHMQRKPQSTVFLLLQSLSRAAVLPPLLLLLPQGIWTFRSLWPPRSLHTVIFVPNHHSWILHSSIYSAC